MAPERPVTTASIIEDNLTLLSCVPSLSSGIACRHCLGPVGGVGYAQCFGCHELFPAVPAALRTATVPMTTTLNPGSWYTRLLTYKTFDFMKGDLLASVAYHFLESNEANITSLLGGPATLTTIVPSTSGFTFALQPLRRTLARVQQLGERLTECMVHVEGQRVPRRSYTPEAFRASRSVNNERVVLIEDTWVTGATAMSVAGALLEAGAASVIVLPIARMVEKFSNYLSPKYLELMDEAPWESTDWARD